MNTRHRELTHSILEFKNIVQTARDNFSQLDTVLKSLSANKLIDDPDKFGDYEYQTRFFGSLCNLFKSPALNKETNQLFVKSLTAWLPLIEIFSSEVNQATKQLNKDSDFQTAKSALLKLTNANRPEENANLLIVYISQFDSMFSFVNSWNKLDDSVKDVIIQHCADKLGLKAFDVDTLFSFPFQHVSRLKLHLTAMAKILDTFADDAELSLLAKRFHETSMALHAKIEEFNSGVAKKEQAALSSSALEKDFYILK